MILWRMLSMAPKPHTAESCRGRARPGSDHRSELAVVAHRRLTDAEEIEACSLYADQHRTLRDIAQLYGLTPAGVLKILIRNHIARRSKGRRNPILSCKTPRQ
jgi:hypothetical protein